MKIRTEDTKNSKLVFIQQESEKTDIRFLEVRGEIIKKVWVRGAGNQKIAAPIGAIDEEDASAEVRHGEANQFRSPAYEIFDWRAPFDCALVAQVAETDLPLTAISPMASGNSTVSTRAFNALEEANSQLRNANRFKTAPGVVFLVPAEEYADDRNIAAAAYGKLTVSVSPGSDSFGDAFYGRDGAFRKDKNTHVSTAIRLRRSGEPGTYFPNPFARLPIDETASLFRGLQRAPVTFR